LHFNPSTASNGPFSAVMTIIEKATNKHFQWKDQSYLIDTKDPVLKVGLGALTNPGNYTIELKLDQHLGYANRFEEYDIPF